MTQNIQSLSWRYNRVSLYMLTVVMVVAVPLKRAPLRICENGLVFLPLLKATQEWNVWNRMLDVQNCCLNFEDILGTSLQLAMSVPKTRRNHRGPNQIEHGGWGTTPMLQQPKSATLLCLVNKRGTNCTFKLTLRIHWHAPHKKPNQQNNHRNGASSVYDFPYSLDFHLCDWWRNNLKAESLQPKFQEGKGKANPCAGLLEAQRVPGSYGSQISRQSAHEGGKVVSPMHQPPLPPGDIPGTHFCLRLSSPREHCAAGRIKSIKNSNDSHQ